MQPIEFTSIDSTGLFLDFKFEIFNEIERIQCVNIVIETSLRWMRRHALLAARFQYLPAGGHERTYLYRLEAKWRGNCMQTLHTDRKCCVPM